MVNVYDVGDAAPITLTLDRADGTTVATVEVTRPDGSTYPLAASPSPDKTEWTTALVCTAPGLWVTTWKVTGLGAGTERHTVSVRGGTPRRGYAHTGDLASWPGVDSVPSNGETLLAIAARVIDAAMVGAIWEPISAADNRPADPEVAAAYRDAVCAQAAAWIEAGGGDPDDEVVDSDAAELAAFAAAANMSSISFGSVSFGLKGNGSSSSSASEATSGPDFEAVAPAALHVLRTAGLWPPRIGLRR